MRTSVARSPRRSPTRGARLAILAQSAWLAAISLALTGCNREPDIVEYVIDTRVPDELSDDSRMLGAIVPQPDDAWFFKVTGKPEEIAQIEGPLRDWLAGLTFEAGLPDMQLPEGWIRRPGSQFRYATLDLPIGVPPLQISVSKLPRAGTWPELVSRNVNRWRGQLGLADSEAPWGGGVQLVRSQSVTTKEPVIWIDITGQPDASKSMSPATPATPPFAGGGPFAGGTPLTDLPPTATAPPPLPADPQVEFETPEGWGPGKMNSMRWAAFNVGPADQQAEMTLISAAGSLLDNIKRWAGQIRDEPVTDEQAQAVIEAGSDVIVDGQPARRYFIPGVGQSPQAIDVTILPLDDGSDLFIKMTGPAETVNAESDRIAKFLESLRLKS